MSQDKFNKNSEHESESEYDSDSEYEDSGSDSCSDNEQIAKRRKLEDADDLPRDENGHVKCYPGQQLGPYEIKSELGEGAFGRVLRVTNVETGESAALKVIKNEPDKRRAAMAEIIALTVIECRDTLNTSLCIKMHDWFSYGGHVCIAFPLLGGSVFDFLRDNEFEPFTVTEVRHIIYQLCSATSFLHKNGITHTDLKPENMLFVNSSFTYAYNEDKKIVRRINCTDIRVIDFGSVTRDNEHHNGVISTIYYRAPEVILHLDWNNSCDIWSIGCIMFELYYGDVLFPTHVNLRQLAMMERILGKIPMEMVNATKTSHFKNGKLDWDWNIVNEEVREDCKPLRQYMMRDCDDDRELFDLIERMLQYDQNRRITSDAALVHHFFEKIPPHQRVMKENVKK